MARTRKVLTVLSVIFMVQSVFSQSGVRLILRGVEYPNNSNFAITDIGEGEAALICQTDRARCCYSPLNRAGEWLFPNGTTVPTEGASNGLYRNRGDDGTVRLNRRLNIESPTGVYYCQVPNANGIHQTLLASITKYSYSYAIISMSYKATTFTLSCATAGGVAVYVNHEMCGRQQSEIIRFSQEVANVAEMTFNNKIQWNSQVEANFICITRNGMTTSYGVLLNQLAIGQSACSSQLVGRVGEDLTLLCVANEPVQRATWIDNKGTVRTGNITIRHLSSSEAGAYTCRGTVGDQVVSSSINLRISNCSVTSHVFGYLAVVNIEQYYTLTCNVLQRNTNCVVEEYYIFRRNELVSRNKSSAFRADSVSGAVNNYYTCTVTLNGSNFTGNPARIPSLIQLPDPISVSISINMDNPIPYLSSPTLSCTVRLPPAIDINVGLDIEWNGPTYGLQDFTTTNPVLNSSADVPIYTSTATLNALGTYYDSGGYSCSVMVHPLMYHGFILNTSAVWSPQISVLFLVPRRPNLNAIREKGQTWIYISWNRNVPTDNVSNYEVQHSYVGDCNEIRWQGRVQILGGANSTLNITGLRAYLNYSITLVAINSTGRSPPNTAFAVTRSTTPTGYPHGYRATLVFSTNITLQWERVTCSERNSEITSYSLHYWMEGDETTQMTITGTDENNRMYTATRLHPMSIYTFTITAVNSGGEMGPNTTISTTTAAPESIVFQLQLNGVHSCLQWRISDPEDKIHDTLVAIVNGVSQHCLYCELAQTDITEGEFHCFAGSPNQVTLRAKVHDRAQATAREIIKYIEQWITSSDVVTLPIHRARLIINNTCVVLLASFDDGECPGHLVPPLQPERTTTSSSSDILTGELTTIARLTTHALETQSLGDTQQAQSSVGAIVGGAVAIVFIITTGFVVVFIVYSVLRYRRQSHSKMKLEASPFHITAKPETDSQNLDDTPLNQTSVKPATQAEQEPEEEMYVLIESPPSSTSASKSLYEPLRASQIDPSIYAKGYKVKSCEEGSSAHEEKQEYENFD